MNKSIISDKFYLQKGKTKLLFEENIRFISIGIYSLILFNAGTRAV